MLVIKVAWYVLRVKNVHPRSPSDPSGTTAHRQGKAEVHILNFETTWSEFQKPSPTAPTQGEAKLPILDFKTTWSQFQKTS